MGYSKYPDQGVKSNWTKQAYCLNMDSNLFFEKYEEQVDIRNAVDKLCMQCPVQRYCLAVGVTRQEWGVWGGVFLEKGKISKEMNNHKNNNEWFNILLAATMEVV